MNHDHEELTKSVIEIVKNATRTGEVNKDSSTKSLSQWDSLAYMSILSEVEINYEIEITEQNINNFDSIESIVNIVQKINQ